LKELLWNPPNNLSSLADLSHIDLKELIVVGAWYIWWQRREHVKGESIAPLNRTAFTIQALAMNFKGAAKGAIPREVQWI
jgi:hypothetical protein